MRIDIANEMAVCVKQMNGMVLDDVLENPDFKNADYWFPGSKVFAELKCLSDDLSTDKAFNESIASLYASWIKRGLLPRTNTKSLRLNLRDLPPICAQEFIDPIKKKLDAGLIKKANRQIRETKEKLVVPDAKGLLLLVNDGNFMLPPTMMMYLLAKMLNGKHSSINSVIYFSANVNSSVPGVNAHCQFWIDALVPQRDPIALKFRKALRTTWFAHLSSLCSGPVIELAGTGSSELLDSIQFSEDAEP